MTSDQKNQFIQDCFKICNMECSEMAVDLIASVVRLVDEKGAEVKISELQELKRKNKLKNYHESKS